MTATTFENLETTHLAANTAQLQQLVNHAENLIRAQVPMLDNLCDADAGFAQRALTVETQVVLRALETGTVFLTADDRAQLRQNTTHRQVLGSYAPAMDKKAIAVHNPLAAERAI